MEAQVTRESMILLHWEELRWLWVGMSAVLGACIGSFLTMASWRIPRDENLTLPRSHCTNCGHTLRPRELFPIFSWLVQRGKCANCATPIHWRYPAIELVTATCFALTLYFHPPFWSTLLLLTLISCTILLIITDLEHWIIPDEVHWVLIPAGFAYRALALNPGAQWPDYAALPTGPAIGLTIGLTLRYGYLWLRKRDGLGWGDVKFLATAGAWVGVAGLVPFLFLGGLLGILFAIIWKLAVRRTLEGMEDAGAHFPFGPALAVSLCMGVFWPESYLLFWTWPQHIA
jgi:leader peptidase (prepilin peptidase)/N-methyltransferase